MRDSTPVKYVNKKSLSLLKQNKTLVKEFTQPVKFKQSTLDYIKDKDNKNNSIGHYRIKSDYITNGNISFSDFDKLTNKIKFNKMLIPKGKFRGIFHKRVSEVSQPQTKIHLIAPNIEFNSPTNKSPSHYTNTRLLTYLDNYKKYHTKKEVPLKEKGKSFCHKIMKLPLNNRYSFHEREINTRESTNHSMCFAKQCTEQRRSFDTSENPISVESTVKLLHNIKETTLTKTKCLKMFIDKSKAENSSLPVTILQSPKETSVLNQQNLDKLDIIQSIVSGNFIDPIKFYRIGKLLGKGAFAKVNLGIHKLTGVKVAIKTIHKELLSDPQSKDKLMREVNILKTMTHPSVIKLYEQFETNSKLYLILELCSGGDLLSLLKKRKKFKEKSAKSIFRQLIEGLKYCHCKGILHRDIKLDNILINEEGNIKVYSLPDSGFWSQQENITHRNIIRPMWNSSIYCP